MIILLKGFQARLVAACESRRETRQITTRPKCNAHAEQADRTAEELIAMDQDIKDYADL
jgi:hypothetical protein